MALKRRSWRLRVAAALFLVLGLSFGLSLAQVMSDRADAGPRRWYNVSRASSGLAPDPQLNVDLAIVQVYAAPTWGWRGAFAVHPWIITKRAGEPDYTRHDVVGWRSPQVVQRDYALPDGMWFGSQPRLLVDHRGPAAVAMLDDIDAAIASYPYAGEYRSWPGPNSNTFLAHIGREVPALKLDLPANAIGKDYRGLTHALGLSPTGSGVQLTLLGLLGVSVGVQEGVEFNLLGLSFGVDLNPPALRLPFIGRLGMDEEVPIDETSPPAPPSL